MFYSIEEKDSLIEDTEYINNNTPSSFNDDSYDLFKGIPFSADHGRYYPQIQELNIINLKQNSVYSYKQLCSVLNQPNKTGSSKKRQLQEFERFFQYTKYGTKYVINEIYDEPLPYLPNTVSNSLYVSSLIDVILNYLSHCPNSILYTSVSELAYICGLKNKSYNLFKSYDMDTLIKRYNAPRSLVELCFFRSSSYHQKIVYSLLKSLMSRGIINSYISYQIFQKADNEDRFIIRDATNYDIKKILYIEDKVLNKMNMTKNQIWLKEDTRDTYFTLLDITIKEEEPLWLTYKSIIKIEIPDWVYNRKEVNTEHSRKEVNQNVFNYLCEKVEDNYKHKIEYVAKESNLEPNISCSIPQQIKDILSSIILLD